MKNTVESLIPFHLRTAILESGRSHTYLAETENLSVVIKCYASGGENALHAHPHEDHMFIVLQGSAQFFNSDGTLAKLGANEGIMLPKGNYYRFHATSDEPLVLLRVGTPNQSPKLSPNRIDPTGEPMVGDSKENKSVSVRFRDAEYFG